MGTLIVGGVLALVGGAISIYSGWKKSKEQQAELQRQKQQEQERTDRQLAIMDAEYDVAKKNANKNADRADSDATLGEDTLSHAYTNAIRDLSVTQEGYGLQNQQQQIASGMQTADAETMLAQSGIRSGSSGTDAIAQQEDMNARSMEYTQKAQNRQSEATLWNAYDTLDNGLDDLQNTRTDAKDLRDSYNPGGDQYNLYQLNRDNVVQGGNATAANYDVGIKNAKYGVWDAVTDGFSGARTGYSVGTSVSSFATNWGAGGFSNAFTGGNSLNKSTGSNKKLFSFQGA